MIFPAFASAMGQTCAHREFAMSMRHTSRLIRTAALLIAPLLWSLTGAALAADGPGEEGRSLLVVSGRASVEAPADELRFVLDVSVEGAVDAPPSVPLRECGARLERVIRSLREVGLAEEEIEASRLSFHPNYEYPRDSGRVFLGYRATATVHVRTKQLDLAGAAVEKAVEAGATGVDGLSYVLSDPRSRRSEVIENAAGHAEQDARVLAAAMGQRIVRVVRVELAGRQGWGPVDSLGADKFIFQGEALEEPDDPLPLRPGMVSITASVRVLYEIAPIQ